MLTKFRAFCRGRESAFTISEIIVSLAVGTMILGVLITSSIAIQRSIAATDQYITSVNNGNRLVDYIAQDLRRAVRVGRRTSGTASTLKDNTSFTITETNVLTINIPDYYASNTVSSTGSSYSTPRYSRNVLNTNSSYNSNETGSPLNGCVPWSDAVSTVGSMQTARFAPVSIGNGEIQVRYFRAPRSTIDSTLCYFRGEYPPNSNTPFSAPVEVAEKVGDGSQQIVVTAEDLPESNSRFGRVFNLRSTFVPSFRSKNAWAAGTAQHVRVTLQNLRRD